MLSKLTAYVCINKQISAINKKKKDDHLRPLQPLAYKVMTFLESL